MIRKYVDVICLNDKNGNIKPLFLVWDETKKYPILKVKDVSPRVKLKAGESGLRYTCIFEQNRLRHLYYDRGKWFVEINEHCV